MIVSTHIYIHIIYELIWVKNRFGQIRALLSSFDFTILKLRFHYSQASILRIKSDDKIIHAEGMDSLSEEELRQACRDMVLLGFLSVEEMCEQYTGSFIAASRYGSATPAPPSALSRGASWLQQLHLSLLYFWIPHWVVITALPERTVVGTGGESSVTSTMIPEVQSSIHSLMAFQRTSGVGKTFTKEIVEEMASLNKKPLILALSNPTSKRSVLLKKLTHGQKAVRSLLVGAHLNLSNIMGNSMFLSRRIILTYFLDSVWA